jgi:uncharacterized protein DUF742
VSVALPDDEPWFDDEAGSLVRPYTVSNGRTRPTKNLDLLSLVMNTGEVPEARLALDHAQVLGLCHHPITVAEAAAQLRLPVAVTKVILSDLVDCGAVITRDPVPAGGLDDRFVLEAVLDGLQRRL